MYSLSVPKENNKKKEKDKEQNSTEELQRLMNTYGNDVLRTSFMYLKDLQKAEDAFQEVFLKVYKKYDSFTGKSSEKTWIIKITINVCKDILRSAWWKRVLLTNKMQLPNKGSDTESLVIKKDENKLLFEGVVSLPTAFKEVIILYYYHGLDTAEVSKVLNVAEGTVRSRLHRARQILKNKLGGRIDFNE